MPIAVSVNTAFSDILVAERNSRKAKALGFMWAHIAAHLTKTGRVALSVSDLAREKKTPERNIAAAIEILEGHGIITRDNTRKRPTWKVSRDWMRYDGEVEGPPPELIAMQQRMGHFH